MFINASVCALNKKKHSAFIEQLSNYLQSDPVLQQDISMDAAFSAG